MGNETLRNPTLETVAFCALVKFVSVQLAPATVPPPLGGYYKYDTRGGSGYQLSTLWRVCPARRRQ